MNKDPGDVPSAVSGGKPPGNSVLPHSSRGPDKQQQSSRDCEINQGKFKFHTFDCFSLFIEADQKQNQRFILQKVVLSVGCVNKYVVFRYK